MSTRPPPQKYELASEEHYAFVRSFTGKITSRGKVIFITGAGISVASGIPDFRSSGGLYEKIIKDTNDKEVLKGKDIFNAATFVNPATRSYFFKFIAELKASCDEAEPSQAHRFVKKLHDRNLLLRNYTQNIDGLETKAGLRTFDLANTLSIPICDTVGTKRRESLGSDKTKTVVVPLHGTLASVVCTVCHHRRVFDNQIYTAYSQGDSVECEQCKSRSDERASRGRRRLHSGIYRPDIVLYNEQHPNGDVIGELVSLDLDMMPTTLIVAGTSLRVPGLKKIVKDFAKAIHHKQSIDADRAGFVVYANKTPSSRSEWKGVFDVELLGECDAWFKLLEDEITRRESAVPRSLPLLTPSPVSVQRKITSFFKTTPKATPNQTKESADVPFVSRLRSQVRV